MVEYTEHTIRSLLLYSISFVMLRRDAVVFSRGVKWNFVYVDVGRTSLAFWHMCTNFWLVSPSARVVFTQSWEFNCNLNSLVDLKIMQMEEARLDGCSSIVEFRARHRGKQNHFQRSMIHTRTSRTHTQHTS